jgi:hypothetical protein
MNDTIRRRLDRLEADDDWTIYRPCPHCGELVRNDTLDNCAAHVVAPPESERHGWITLRWAGGQSNIDWC